MHTAFSHLPILGLAALLADHAQGAALKHAERDFAIDTALPSGWTYSGCYTDETNPRTLHADGYADDAMTESTCINYCNGKGYSFAGVEYGRECYCDNRILDTGLLKADSECSFTCPGSSSGSCGAGNRMSIFSNGKGLSTGPVVNPGFDNWKSLGCYTDSIGERTLEFPANVDNINTAARCASACQQAGYTYAGLEYGQECYCGSSLRCPSAPTIASACNMACNGNATEVCGGPNAMNVYHLGSEPLLACGVTPSSTSISSVISATTTPAALCPNSNNTVYTDVNGHRYTTYCGFDYGGGNIDVGDLASYELCLQKCDTVASCGAVAWTGGDGRGFCYLKEATSELVSNGNVIAAIRIPDVVSSSSVVSSTLSSSADPSSSQLSSSFVSITSSSSSAVATITEGSSLTYPQCAGPPDNKASGSCQCTFELTPDSVFRPNFAPIGISVVDSLSSCLSLCDNTFFDCLMGDYDCATGTCRLYPQGGSIVPSTGKTYFSKRLYQCSGQPNNGICTAQKFVPGATPSVSSSSATASLSGIATSSATVASSGITSSSQGSSTLTLSSSSSSSSSTTPPPSVITPTTTKGLGCPNPTPTAMVFGDQVYEYEWCMAYMGYDSVNFSPGSFEGCAKACALGDCVAFNYGDPQNCRTIQKVSTVTTSFYNWKAYSLVGVTPVTDYSFPSITSSPTSTRGLGCPNPTPTALTISGNIYNYEWCMAYMNYGSVNFSPGSFEGCAAACALKGDCVAFNYGDAQNCRTMNSVAQVTTSFYNWKAYSLVGVTPVAAASPTASAASSVRTISVNVISTTVSVSSSSIPLSTSTSASASPSVTLGPYGTNACPNPTQTSYTISNTLYRYNFCMAYLAPGSVNMYAADAPACAALCKGDCVAFNFGDPQNCRTMNRVDAITAPFYGWSAYQLIGATPLPTVK